MATGTILARNLGYLQIQYSLPASVTVNSGGNARLLDSVNLHNVTATCDINNQTVKALLTNKRIVGVIFLWTNGAACSEIDCLSSDTSVTLSVFNPSGSNITASKVRLGILYEG